MVSVRIPLCADKSFMKSSSFPLLGAIVGKVLHQTLKAFLRRSSGAGAAILPGATVGIQRALRRIRARCRIFSRPAVRSGLRHNCRMGAEARPMARAKYLNVLCAVPQHLRQSGFAQL